MLAKAKFKDTHVRISSFVLFATFIIARNFHLSRTVADARTLNVLAVLFRVRELCIAIISNVLVSHRYVASCARVAAKLFYESYAQHERSRLHPLHTRLPPQFETYFCDISNTLR